MAAQKRDKIPNDPEEGDASVLQLSTTIMSPSSKPSNGSLFNDRSPVGGRTFRHSTDQSDAFDRAAAARSSLDESDDDSLFGSIEDLNEQKSTIVKLGEVEKDSGSEDEDEDESQLPPDTEASLAALQDKGSSSEEEDDESGMDTDTKTVPITAKKGCSRESSSEEEDLSDEEQNHTLGIPPGKKHRGRRTAAEMLAASTAEYLGENYTANYGHEEPSPKKQKKQLLIKKPVAPARLPANTTPRKRGRPPKKPAASAPTKTASATQPPKKRGRPPKSRAVPRVALLDEVGVNASTTAATSSGAYDVPITPRKRGRPRKDAAKPASSARSKAVVTPSPSPSPQPVAYPAIVSPKKRGRPPKRKV